MDEQDYKKADAILNAWVNASLEEVADSNRKEHRHIMRDDDLKAAMGLGRLHPKTRTQVLEHFETRGVESMYNEETKTTTVFFTFGELSLTPTQAKNYSRARENYRTIS